MVWYRVRVGESLAGLVPYNLGCRGCLVLLVSGVEALTWCVSGSRRIPAVCCQRGGTTESHT